MRELDQRRLILLTIFYSVGIIFVIRLFYLQVIDDTAILSAENQSLRYVKQFAPRGMMFDRKGKKMVHNEAVYDIMVTTKMIKKDFDTLKFCEVVGITKTEFEEKLTKIKAVFKKGKGSPLKPVEFIEQLTSEQYAPIMEKMDLFPAFSFQVKNIRKIPLKCAPHVIGYVGEVDRTIIEKDSTYKEGDYIGANGLEKTYEKYIRGQNGYHIYIANIHNVQKERYKNGEKDIPAVPGKNLNLTIDLDLQLYGEKLMQNKTGSIVAIEPATGEVLAMISSPGYDPNLLVGRDRTKNYKTLAQNDSLNPLFNRALMAEYPPGSIFKLLQSLVALQEGDITEHTGFPCNKALVGCHDHPNAYSLREGIRYSCNPYFFQVFRNILSEEGNMFEVHARNLDKWHKMICSFGLGKRTGIDIWGERKGNIPNAAFYDKIYGKRRWAFSTIYSLSIGQGELLIPPVQMANIVCSIANRGFYYTPHLVKKIEGEEIDAKYKVKNKTLIDPEYFIPVIDGMQEVVETPGGTASRARVKDITVCGKTGTAQNPHGEDHSIFIAFAPKEKPQIAISVYLENSGFGGTWAAPIASLMIEKYLKGQVQDTVKEKYILDKKFY